MRIVFSKITWEDYTSWQKIDKIMLSRMNDLIKDIQKNLQSGIGKPEPLKFDLAGYWTRRIDQEHKLEYQVMGNDLRNMSCKYHYDK